MRRGEKRDPSGTSAGMRPIPPRKVLLALLALVGALVLASFATQVVRFHFGHDYAKGLVPLFSVDREHNVPTWFITVVLFVCSALLATIAAGARAGEDRFAGRWTLLAAGFLAMSLDEAAAIHELLILPLRGTLGLGGIFYFSWVVVGLAAVILLGIYFLPFLKALPRTWRRLFLAAAALYVGGALGMELVSGAYVDARGYDDMTYAMLALAEETLEMVGATVFLYALLTYIGARSGEIRVPLPVEREARQEPDG